MESQIPARAKGKRRSGMCVISEKSPRHFLDEKESLRGRVREMNGVETFKLASHISRKRKRLQNDDDDGAAETISVIRQTGF